MNEKPKTPGELIAAFAELGQWPDLFTYGEWQESVRAEFGQIDDFLVEPYLEPVDDLDELDGVRFTVKLLGGVVLSVAYLRGEIVERNYSDRGDVDEGHLQRLMRGWVRSVERLKGGAPPGMRPATADRYRAICDSYADALKENPLLSQRRYCQIHGIGRTQLRLALKFGL